MNIARINCSHGDRKQYLGFIRKIRAVSKDIAIMLDTQGPEIRTGLVKTGTVLKQDSEFILTTKKILGDDEQVYVNYKGLVSDVKPGEKIFIDSGFLSLRVKRKTKDSIICKVVNGGPLGNRKGVNHPACLAKMPVFTKKDREDISFGLKNGIDFVAASFIRGPKDVIQIKSFLGKHHVKVIAKIENSRAVENIDKITAVADAVMVARGDLGVELPQSRVPLIQKMIIRKCNVAGVPVTTATQMLESMVRSPRPTRAEAGDVANAILDGTDSVMLSEETAIGKYSDKAVSMMVQIARITESALQVKTRRHKTNLDEAIAKAVHDIVEDVGISKVVVATCSGFSAQLIAKYRPNADIIAVTPTEQVVRQMALYWGIHPLLLKDGGIKSTRDLIFNSIKTAYNRKMIKKSNRVVVAAAHPFNIKGKTNLLELHTVGDILKRGPSAK